MIQKLALGLFLLAFAMPLRADEDLQNGDFADGITHWHGDGRSPADFASDNPLQASDPFTAKGLIVPLKQTMWTKVAQDFRGHLVTGILTVMFKVSPDLAFSTNPEDYHGIPAKLGWGWQPFNTPPGSWMAFLSRDGDTAGNYFLVKTKTGSSNPQGVRFAVRTLTPMDSQTITLAFPPGTGTIVILGVSLSDKPGQPQGNP